MLAAQAFFTGRPDELRTHLERYVRVRPFVLSGHREAAIAALAMTDDLKQGGPRWWEPWVDPVCTILGRDKSEWHSAVAAEADLRKVREMPKSRQVRRAEARAAAKRRRRSVAGKRTIR